jgi:hypothetical protein
MVIVRRFGALSRHGSDSGLSRFSRPLSAVARDFKPNRNHICGNALLLGAGFCRAVGSPGEEKSPGAKRKIPCRLRCPGLNLQKLYGPGWPSAIISWFAEGCSDGPNKNAVNQRCGRNNPGASRRQGESA